jgi:hypothetical protein
VLAGAALLHLASVASSSTVTPGATAGIVHRIDPGSQPVTLRIEAPGATIDVPTRPAAPDDYDAEDSEVARGAVSRSPDEPDSGSHTLDHDGDNWIVIEPDRLDAGTVRVQVRSR